MSSERLHPQTGSLDPGVALDALDALLPTPGAGGLAWAVAEGPAFAVDWEVRPSQLEPDAAEPESAPDPAPAAAGTAPAASCTFDIARVLGTVVVTVRGPLEEAGARALGQALEDLIENQGNMTVVVDLHGVTDVDPRCLDIFVAASGWAVSRGGQVSLTGSRLQVGRALEETGVSQLVQVTPDRILAVPSGTADPVRSAGSDPTTDRS